jgi:hypothetical protein
VVSPFVDFSAFSVASVAAAIIFSLPCGAT